MSTLFSLLAFVPPLPPELLSSPTPKVAPMEFREFSSAISSDLPDRFARVTSNVSTEGVILFFFFFLLKESKNGGKRELDAWAAAIFEH